MNVVAVVLAGGERRSSNPEPDNAPRSDLITLARANGIPIVWIRRLDAAAVAGIAAHAPDAIVAACFPWRLPNVLLALPPLGCLNVHPSLLPLGRGPEPVFWTLRRGERRTGVTVHGMDTGFDTGPILGQTAIAVPDGIDGRDLEYRLAELGGALLVEVIAKLAAGTASPIAQDHGKATFAPMPSVADYLVPTNLPARWAFNFVRGVMPLGVLPKLAVGATGERFPLRDAVAFNPDATLDRPYFWHGERLIVRFRPGTVEMIIAAPSPSA